ncbi:MAG: carboxypeptidase-like regulatory domain-containing protein, partial [Patescibacteria group bacterium]
ATGSSTSGGTRIATVTSVSFGDSGLNASTQYSYYVVARDAASNASPASNTATASTQAKPPTSVTGAIKGKVKGRNGRALAGAQVVLRVNNVRKFYTTNRNGDYTIKDLPAGRYTVRYQAKGYRSQTITIRVKTGVAVTRDVNLRTR